MSAYPILIPLIFNALDLISGLLCAVKNKQVSSSKLRDGLFKKVGFILCYILAYLFDAYSSVIGFQLNVSILPIVILYVCTTESVSIIENICGINPDLLPDKLLEMFQLEGDGKHDAGH